jgi:hypothetical protein
MSLMDEAQFDQLTNLAHSNAWVDGLLTQINFGESCSATLPVATCYRNQPR